MVFDIDGKLRKEKDIKDLRNSDAFVQIIDDKERMRKYDEIKNKLQEYYRLVKENKNLIFEGEFCNKLAVDLIEWITSEGNYYIKEFFSSKYINDNKLKKMLESNEYLRECYNLAIDIQESKLVVGGLKKNSNINLKQAQFILQNVHKMVYKEEPEKDVDSVLRDKAKSIANNVSDEEALEYVLGRKLKS